MNNKLPTDIFTTVKAMGNSFQSLLSNTDKLLKSFDKKVEDFQRNITKISKSRNEKAFEKYQVGLAGIKEYNKQKELISAKDKEIADSKQTQGLRQKEFLDALNLTIDLYMPVKVASQVQEVLADIEKISDKGFSEKAKKWAKSISTVMPVATAEVLKAITVFKKSGLDDNDVQNASTLAAKLAQVYKVNTEQAASFVLALKNGTNTTADDVNKLIDVIDVLSNNYQASAPDLYSVSSNLDEVANKAGTSKTNLLAITAALADNTTTAMQAANSLEKMFSVLNNSGVDNDGNLTEIGEFIKDIGFEPGTISENMQEDFFATFSKIMQGIKKYNPKEKNTFTDIFGDEDSQVLNKMSLNDKKVVTAVEVANNSEVTKGSLSKSLGLEDSKIYTKIDVLKNKINNLHESLGNALMPSALGVAWSLGKILSTITWAIDCFPNLTLVVMTAVAGFASLNTMMTGAAYAKAFMITSYLNLSKIIAIANAQLILYKSGVLKSIVVDNIAALSIRAKALGLSLLTMGFVNTIKSMVAYILTTKIGALCTTIFSGALSFLSVAFAASPIGLLITLLAAAYGLYKYFTSSDDSSSNSNDSNSNNNSSDLSSVPYFGRGGVLTSPTLAVVGDKPETIIPHKRDSNSLSLYASLGKKLGINNDIGSENKNNNLSLYAKTNEKVTGSELVNNNNSETKNINVSYAPNITINGRADEFSLQTALSKSQVDLEKMLREIANNNNRVSFI